MGPRWPRSWLLLVTIGGCSSSADKGPDAPGDTADNDVADAIFEKWCPADAVAVDRWVDDTLGTMSLDEKVAQMAGSSVFAHERGYYETPEDPVHGIPAFRMMDGPRGAHTESGPATSFPVGMARGATWSPALEAQVGEAIAAEVQAVGANVLLAPTINVLRHPRWGRSQETYGEDPLLLGALGRAFVEGAQTRVLAQPKHLAVNSIEDTRLHVDVQIDDSALHEVYLPHFREVLIEGGAATVMAAYNHINGPPAAESPQLLTDILRDDWGFPGAAVSDWVWAVETTEGAANAGLDIEMPVGQHFGADLVDAVQQGNIDEAVVDAAVARILRTKRCFGLALGEPTLDPSLRLTPAHLDLAQRVAERGSVLLHNDGAMPIDGGLSIAVTGRLADVENIGDTGSSNVDAPDVSTVLEGLQTHASDRTVMLVDETDAAALASADVVVVVVGLTAEDEGEDFIGAGDRADLRLSTEDLTTIARASAASDRVMVVLQGGGAIVVDDWIDDVQGILMVWYPGARGGDAVARLLYGTVPPAGRMPLTVPHVESDLPPFDNTSLVVTYDHFHGYRHLDRTGVSARFAFGFGLSTTSFAWGPAEPETTTLSDATQWTVVVPVTNTGDRDGVETVQLYGGPTITDPRRPARKLLAFAQVDVAPGETVDAVLTVDTEDLRIHEDGLWQTIPGAYTFEVARSSAETIETLDLTLR